MHFHSARFALIFLVTSALIFQPNLGIAFQNLTTRKPVTQQADQGSVQNVTFRLLAVEQSIGNVTVTSAQRLIESVTSFSNWRNNTVSAGFQYFSYIDLLSEADPASIDTGCQAFYKGKASKINLMNEISTFLTERIPSENNTLSVRILYYAGNTNKIVEQGNTSFCLALDQLVHDWELDQALKKNEAYSSSYTLVILDTCYSGGYIATLARPGRIVFAACSPDETIIAQPLLKEGNHDYWSWFTGNESVVYPNGTDFGALGIIGAMKETVDLNQDGWRSASEIFAFASQTTRWYAANQTNPETGKPFTLNTWASFGVVGGEIPIVQFKPSAPFPFIGKVLPALPLSPDPYRYDSEDFQCQMYRYSPLHTGFLMVEGPETSNVLWSHFLSDPITSSPAVSDGLVFVGTVGGRFYALEMTTGEIVWSFSTGSSVSSSPAINKGIIVFGCHEPGRIYALDEYTGLIRWTYEIPGEDSAFSSPTIKEDKVLAASSDGFLRAFTLFEGSIILESYIGGNITASPAVSGGTVFITGNDVNALDELTGTRTWRFDTSWPVFSSPAVDDGIVYVGTGNDDTAYALNATTGEPLWGYKTGGWFSSPAIDIDEERIILGCRDGRIYCLNKKTGWPIWDFITEGANYMSAPTISGNGLVYVGSFDGNVYCLSEDTGRKVWSYATGGAISSSPVVTSEHVFVGSENGYLYCFGPKFKKQDVAISNVTVSPRTCKPGQLVEIEYSAKNLGETPETVTIAFNYNRSNIWESPRYLEPTTFHTETIRIERNSTVNSSYTWNTSNIPPGRYNITVQATLLPDETEASNNIFIDCALLILMPTDLDANGMINIVDVATVAKAYGNRPGDENWNQNVDFDNNGIINIVDVAAVAKDFGKIY